MQRSAAMHVLVSHHDPLLHRGIVSTLSENPLFVVTEPGHGAIRLPLLDAPHVRVLVTDLSMGINAASHLREHDMSRLAVVPEVLVLSGADGELCIRHALERGIKGYLTQDCRPEQLVDAVLTLADGRRYLQGSVVQRLADSLALAMPTPREIEVLRLVATGLCNKAIAMELDIACGTVKTHVKALLEKLGVRTRTAAADIAKRRGLLDALDKDPRLEHRRPVMNHPGSRFTRIHTLDAQRVR